MAQFALPDADITNNTWVEVSGGDGIIWNDIDEGISSLDANRVQTSNNPTAAEDFIGTLSSVTDPVSSSAHTIRINWNKSGSGGRTIEANAELWQGDPDVSGSLVASIQTADIGSTPATDTHALSSGEADSITDYSALYLRMYAVTSGGGAGRRLRVDAFELEVPDAAAGARRVMVVS